MTTGWICPKCGRVYGPLVMECAKCNRKIYATVSSNSFDFGAEPNKINRDK